MSRTLAVNVFEPLVRADASGDAAPALATSWSNPSPGRWVFRLRPNATFSDGTPVDATEVVRSFERARGPKSLVAGVLSGVRELRADDATTFSFEAPESRRLLHSMTAVLVSKEVAAPDGTASLIGSGPYAVTRIVPGDRFEMAAFAGHPHPPPIRAVSFERYRSGDDVRARLALGPAVVLDPPAEALAAVKGNRNFRVASEFNGVLWYLAFGLHTRADGSRRPFFDLQSRQAVRLAVDLPALASATAGGAVPASQVIPPGIHGVDPTVPPPTRDLDAARRLLAAAPVGPVALDSAVTTEKVASAVAAQLREAGMEVAVNPLDSRTFQEKIDGYSDFYLYNWVVGEDGGDSLERFFHTKDLVRGFGSRNRIGYSNKTFDETIERAATEGKLEARLPIIQAATRILDQDLPWVPLYAPRSVRIHPADVTMRFRSDGMLVLAEVEPVNRR